MQKIVNMLKHDFKTYWNTLVAGHISWYSNRLKHGWLEFNSWQQKEVFSSPVSRLVLGPIQLPSYWVLGLK
jgi:hypothetical protein